MGVLEKFSLAGRRALVTGGNRGLGFEQVIALRDAGAHGEGRRTRDGKDGGRQNERRTVGGLLACTCAGGWSRMPCGTEVRTAECAPSPHDLP